MPLFVGASESYDTDAWEAYNLKKENAKLRELVRDFDKCLDTALYLADSAGYLTMPDQKLFASLRQRMRELGVEADG